jgi:uncharacterized protein (TIGR02246 family)
VGIIASRPIFWTFRTSYFGLMGAATCIATAIAALAFAGRAGKNDKSSEPTMYSRNEDLQAIEQLAADWRSGWLAGDVDALLSLYADDPVLMPQGQPVVRGKEAIRPLYQAVLSEVAIKSESTLMEVEVSGDWGYFWSTYTLTATSKAGGETISSEGKSLFIVKRQPGGAWKITRLIDNSSR